MKKGKRGRQVKVLTLEQFDKDGLRQLADSPEAQSLGIFRDGDGVGFIAGDFGAFNQQSLYGPLHENEFWGEGVPYECSCDSSGSEFCLAHGTACDPNAQQFEMRTLRREGFIEFQIAEIGGDRFTAFPVGEGLTDLENAKVQFTFEMLLRRFLADSCNDLLLACCAMVSDDRTKKDEAFEKITGDVSNRFKSLLKWDRHKMVSETKDGGITRTIVEPIERGRHPEAASEIKSEREVFKEDVFKAFAELESIGTVKRTRIAVGNIITAGNGDAASYMSRKLSKLELDWMELKEEYERRKKMAGNSP